MLSLGQMLQGQMYPGQMSPRHLPTRTDDLTNQSSKFGQVRTSNIRDMALYLLEIYSVGNNINMNMNNMNMNNN